MEREESSLSSSPIMQMLGSEQSWRVCLVRKSVLAETQEHNPGADADGVRVGWLHSANLTLVGESFLEALIQKGYLPK